jgi:hypothetical protein
MYENRRKFYANCSHFEIVLLVLAALQLDLRGGSASPQSGFPANPPSLLPFVGLQASRF